MYNNILNYIYDRIYVNGRGEIDPIKLREVFEECLYTLGGNANFMGVASTAGPIEITPDSKQVYIALPSNVDQVYSGFGEEEGTSFTLPAGCLGLFYYAANQWNHITLETPNYKEIPFISGRNSYRTLTQDEWAYLLETRGASTVEGTSNARYAKAKINDVNGLIIFPDYYTKPSGISITNINTGNAAFEDNTYTLEEWGILENSEVVFLPCSGSRLGYEITNINISGFYWSSTKHLDNVISGVIINSTMVSSGGAFGPNYGYAVRLVNESKSGFSVALNKSVGITKGNLQYKADTDDWRFAPEAWQCIGLENSHIGENYSGWIDLFGYGTSGWNNGATYYQPWSSSVTSTDYLNESLTGNYDRSDWGIWISRKIHTDELPVGVPNGVAGLDANGQVPSSQLPSYVDDVIEGYLYNNHFYTDQEHTTLVDEDQAEGKIYIDLSDDKTYRWSGSVYVEISKSLVLGTTHTTAFYGDYGQTAYNHATDANRNITAKSKKLYKISVTSEGHVGQVEESTAESDIEALQDNVEDLNNGLFPGDWRTPTGGELGYILNTRSASTLGGTSNARYAKAQIGGINGLIIFPDVISLPSEIVINNINTANALFTGNTFTTDNWEYLEGFGCIFLPVGGRRVNGATTQDVNSKANYWTSTQFSVSNSNSLHFYDGSVSVGTEGKNMGASVRLIKDDNTNGTFSFSASTKGYIAKSNIQFHCLNKTWRFAENAYDVIGSGNNNIAENYNGWIDLFGYGTSNWNSGATCYQPWSVSTTVTDYINHDLTGDYKNADWGVFAIKKQLQPVAFSGNYDDLENKPFYDITLEVQEYQPDPGGTFDIDITGFDVQALWNAAIEENKVVRISLYPESEAIPDNLPIKFPSISECYTNLIATIYDYGTEEYEEDNQTYIYKYLILLIDCNWNEVNFNSGELDSDDTQKLCLLFYGNEDGTYWNDYIIAKVIGSEEEDTYPLTIDGRTQYRTLLKPEFDYILNTRAGGTVGATSNARYAKARVANVDGLIIFPDSINLPDSEIINVNDPTAGFSDNDIPEEDWSEFEERGCVFLPCSGSTSHGEYFGDRGYYRTASIAGTTDSNGWTLAFTSGTLQFVTASVQGASVRLVIDVDNSHPGTFTINSNSDRIKFTRGNLQINESMDAWRFAPNPWDFCGVNNETYTDGLQTLWLDLYPKYNTQWKGYVNGNDLTGQYAPADWGVWISKKYFSGSFNDLEDKPLPTVYSEATITWDVTNVRNVITLAESVPYDKAMLSIRITDVSTMQRGQIIALYINGEYRNISTPRPDGSSNSLNTCYTNNNDVLTLYYDSNVLILLDRRNYIDTNFVYFTNNNQSSDTYKFLCPNGITGERLMSKEYIGKVVYVYFTNTNTAQNPEFLIEFNNTASASHKPIKYKGTVITTDNLDKAGKAGCIACYVYDGNYWNWLFDSSCGALEFASTAEAIDGTETEKVMSPATNKAAHDARHWFGTRAEFDTLEQGGLLSEDVIYHVEEVQGENNEIVIVSMIGTSDLSTMTLTVTSSSHTPAEIETLVGSGKTVICKFGDGVDLSSDIYMNYVGSLTFSTAAMGVNIYISYRNNSWSGKIIDIVNRVPEPNTQDEGKLLSVNASGEYELVTIVNAENVPY